MLQIIRIYENFFSFLTKYLTPIFALTMRYLIFKDFFRSGYLKVQYLYNDQWATVIYLLSNEYRVPFLSPQIAAALGTFNEVVFSSLIMLGFATRFSALVIFGMAILIEFSYGDSLVHYIWMICAGYLILNGPGQISADFLINKKLGKNS